MSKITLAEQSSAPSTPASGKVVVYTKSDRMLYNKDDSGLEARVGEVKGGDVASASTIDLDAATGNLIDVTGTTTITAVTLAEGKECTVRFTGILTLTHGASLVLPNNGSNITTAAGDTAIFRGYASSVVRCIVYQRLNGNSLQGSAAATQAEMESASSTSVQVTPGRQHFHPGHPKCWAYVTVAGGAPTLQTSYNITSITDTGEGQLTITIATDFSTANWASMATVEEDGGNTPIFASIASGGKAAGSILINCDNVSAADDPGAWNFVGFGDHA